MTASAAGSGDAGTVYLLHLDPAYRHARHYLGWTRDLDARLQAHREGRGARLMEVVKQAGGTFHLARTWPGNRDRERAIKNRHEAPKLCPECSPRPKPVQAGKAAAHPAAPHPAAAEPVATPAPAPARPDPYTQGRSMARSFLQAQQAANRTADQITATHAYVTGPWREAAHHSAAQTETMRGYTGLITEQLMHLRQAEAGAAERPFEQPPQPEMEAGQ